MHTRVYQPPHVGLSKLSSLQTSMHAERRTSVDVCMQARTHGRQSRQRREDEKTLRRECGRDKIDLSLQLDCNKRQATRPHREQTQQVTLPHISPDRSIRVHRQAKELKYAYVYERVEKCPCMYVCQCVYVDVRMYLCECA